jgi:hypothetical protein
LGKNSEFYFISRLRNETGLRIPELYEFGFEVKIHPHSVVMPGNKVRWECGKMEDRAWNKHILA